MKKIILFITIVLTHFTYLNAQHGIDPDWYQSLKTMPKFNSTWDASGAVANNMVVDKNGRIIIFYTEQSGSQIKHYFTGSNDNGNTWTQPSPTLFTPSTKTGGNSTLSADIDTNDVIHVIWSSKISKAVYYASSTASTLSWSDTTRIGLTAKNRIGFCQISTDRKMRLHAYWHEGDTKTADTAEVFYTQSLDGGLTWSNQLMLSLGEAKHSAFPSGDFYGVKGDTLAIAWRDSVGVVNSIDQDWDVKMVVSSNGGVSWSTPFTVAGGNGMQSDPGVIVDKNNIIHIAYHYYPQVGGILDAQVFYGYSSNIGVTWNPANFSKISVNNVQSHLVKAAYDYENDVVWYFYKDQMDYVSPFDKRADIMAVNITNGGTNISSQEFISDADSSEAGFHNFKVGKDGIPRAHFFIIPYDTNQPVSLFYTQRTFISTNIIQQNNLIDKLNIYPNPANAILNIQNIESASSVRIMDIRGRKIIEINNSTSNKINIEHLENGVYLLNILYKEGERKTIRFIKQY